MDWWQDVRFAIRSLTRQRSVAIAAIATLAVGIGATTSVFTVADGILRHPMPYPYAERTVHVVSYRLDPNGPTRTWVMTLPYFRALRERATTITGIGGYDSFSRVTRQRLAATIAGGSGAARLLGTRLSPVLFSTLGVAPVLGRAFEPAEEEPGRNAVVIISHRAWQNVYGSGEDVLERSFTLDGRSYSIVGVMPPGFAFPDSQTDFWIPLTPRDIPPSEPLSDSPESYYADSVYGRLADGVSARAANNEVDAILRAVDLELIPRRSAQLRSLYEQRAALPRRAEAVPMRDELVAPARPALGLLSLTVAVVLLIACANVVNLMLARSASRRREMALKAALGATATRLLRSVLTETVLLALLGGGLGLTLAFWAVNTAVRLAPAGIPRIEEIGIDARVLLYTVLVSGATGLVVGLLPAARVLRADALLSLTVRITETPSRFPVRNLIVAGQIALTAVLLIGAGLLVRSFVSLISISPGFDARGVLAFQVVTPANYEADQQRLFRDLLEQLKAITRVEAAGATDVLPIAGRSAFRFSLEGLPIPPGPTDTMVMRIVSGGYFEAMAIPVLEGRVWSNDEAGRRPEPIVVNREFVRRYFGAAHAVGRVVGRHPALYEVVGIVDNVRHAGLQAEPEPEYYVDLRNTPLPAAVRPYFVVRIRADAASVAPAVRAIVRQLDPRLGVDLNLEPMADIVSKSVARPRFQMALLSTFAAVALILAGIGVYGVMAYSVEQRTREIGVRMALGATGGNVVRLVLAQGLAITAAGMALGLAGAFAATRLLNAMLFRLTPLDPLTFVLAPLTLGVVASLAAYLPARRAATVDPVVALRSE
jgi:putative ABC transport system permease protein